MLQTECMIFTRYLIGEEARPEVVERYRRAHDILFVSDASERELRVVRFSIRHPGALPFLDAASAFYAKDGLLRRKLLLLTAILEAHPAFTTHFIPGPVSPARFVLRGFLLGLSGLGKALIGSVLFAAVQRRG